MIVVTPVVVVTGGDGVMVIVLVGTYGFLGTQMLCTQTASHGYRPAQSALLLQPTFGGGGG